ncbi:MAG: hypothetical protein QM831_38490 [Kofleriaceae bacterium]
MAQAPDIDRLIEEGLNRYGSGDLDGALLVWEEALAIDPDNAQANSYVDYVRMNYDLLATDGGSGALASDDFGIEDEPEYIIEITRELPSTDAPMYVDPLDEGWFIEDEDTRELFAARTRSANMPPVVVRTISADLPPGRESAPRLVELEADEPPSGELELELGPPVRPSAPEVSFDSATREYGADDHKAPPPRATSANDFADDSGGFRTEATPLGFSHQETEIKKRELGFVQPVNGPARLEVRLRTPSAPPPVTSSGDMELGGAGRGEPSPTERGLAASGRGPAIPATSTEDDLIKSLPQPRKVTPVRGSQPLTAAAVPSTEEPPRTQPITRDMPNTGRPPAAAPTDRAVTKAGDDEDIALPSAATRELATQATSPANLVVPGPPAFDDFAINAPTRELGLRQQAQAATTPPPNKKAKRAPSVLPDDDNDVPTRQNDARAIREEHSTLKMKPVRAEAAKDGTRTDFVLPFDPIDARSAQILDEIEPAGTEPVGESKEDRLRRRVTALIEKAQAWGQGGELDKAVAAVDLALSEDPNAALAQKLIHRNRDAIMNIFQMFLGDLDRQPQLARPLHELATAPISPRAAFLLSRIDGTLTIDEILDVSGMPRLEAYRHLCQLFLRGILR